MEEANKRNEEQSEQLKRAAEQALRNKDQDLANKSAEKKEIIKYADEKYDELLQVKKELERQLAQSQQSNNAGTTGKPDDAMLKRLEEKNEEMRLECLASKKREAEMTRKAEDNERNMQEMLEKLRRDHMQQMEKMEKHINAKMERVRNENAATSEDSSARGSDWRPSL